MFGDGCDIAAARWHLPNVPLTVICVYCRHLQLWQELLASKGRDVSQHITIHTPPSIHQLLSFESNFDMIFKMWSVYNSYNMACRRWDSSGVIHSATLSGLNGIFKAIFRAFPIQCSVIIFQGQQCVFWNTAFFRFFETNGGRLEEGLGARVEAGDGQKYLFKITSKLHVAPWIFSTAVFISFNCFGIGKKSTFLRYQVVLLEVHLPMGRPLHGVFQVASLPLSLSPN